MDIKKTIGKIWNKIVKTIGSTSSPKGARGDSVGGDGARG